MKAKEIKKRIIPCNKKCEPIAGAKEREYIFFKVEFNSFRDVSGSSENAVLDREEMRECECVLALPESYSDTGAPTQLVLSCHGAGSKVCEADNMIGGVDYVSRCIDEGYAALDVNGSLPHGSTMGCPEHLLALYKAYKYAIANSNLTDRVLVSGASMGGQTALNFANMYPSITLSVGIFFPRLNIDGVYVGDHYCIGTWDKDTKNSQGISTKDRLISVFKFPSDDWCEENTIGSNPYRLRSFVNSDGERVVIPPCPIKLWQGTIDKVTDPVMAEEFIRSVRRSGSYAELRLIEGIGHAVTDVMREELLLWFNRFV